MQANHSVSYLYESSTSKRSNGLFSQTQKQESFQKALNQTQEEIEDEDLMVDLNTGSLTPVKLKYWTQMSAMMEKFGKL
ncbi:BAH_G0032080.mRNA.1.CDS.1 [Saccharomyces cerevisiae]|nr:BAH_G0032080.mRNA.1.CDS.1 [Saccharomyces cerevisiae]CAI7182394.1 BAH_G0032080.mRNA.1.CDS.1 [Saccharomyces cerevisiae]